MGAAASLAKKNVLGAPPTDRPQLSRPLSQNMIYERGEDANIDDFYAYEKKLGEGSMGEVARIRHRKTGRLCALKTIMLVRVSKGFIAELRNEISLLMKLDHPNIIRPLELFEMKKRRQVQGRARASVRVWGGHAAYVCVGGLGGGEGDREGDEEGVGCCVRASESRRIRPPFAPDIFRDGAALGR